MKYTLRVKRKEHLTENACYFLFGIPDDLKSVFKYEAGQYVCVHIVDKTGVQHKRYYSICSPPESQDIGICVKRVKNGIVSNYLIDELYRGYQIGVEPPEGIFTLESTGALPSENLVFITGGSGITPIKSMISHLVETDFKGSIFLIYGNTNAENIIFADYCSSIDDRVKIIHTLDVASPDWPGEEGRLTISHINFILEKYNIPLENTAFFLSGPPIIIKNAKHCLGSHGVDYNNVFVENFFIENESFQGLETVCQTRIKIGNSSKLVQVEARQSILDAALTAGLNIKHGCKVGNCLSCVAKVNCGKVYSNVEITGVKDFILTCQSYPLDNTVEVAYNSRKAASVLPQRSRLLAVSFFISLFVLLFAMHPENEGFLAKGDFNTGHEDLRCMDCHKSAPGNARQQLQHNIKYYLGMESSLATFGYEPVDNKVCMSCHDRPNDRHPVHRFEEPRFAAVRKLIHPENCTSCHAEHSHQRITTASADFCKHCHEDVQIHNDPLDVKHDILIKTGQWNTCLQCHDFHGNHKMEIPVKMKDTIPQKAIRTYYEGGDDPYGDVKAFIAKLPDEAASGEE